MKEDVYKKIFSKNLQKLMNLYGKTQVDIINDLGFTRSAVSSWVTGTRLPRMDKVDLLANYFHCKRSDLIEDKPASESSDDTFIDSLSKRYPSIHQIERRSIPMLGSVACGKPIFANRDYNSYVMADTDIDADYCLTASGDSMINARIFDGDIVFIKEMSSVENGDIAVVVIDEEVTLKRVYYYRESNVLQLVAENPAYAPMVYTGEELDHIHIMGKAVFFQSLIR